MVDSVFETRTTIAKCLEEKEIGQVKVLPKVDVTDSKIFVELYKRANIFNINSHVHSIKFLKKFS